MMTGVTLELKVTLHQQTMHFFGQPIPHTKNRQGTATPVCIRFSVAGWLRTLRQVFPKLLRSGMVNFLKLPIKETQIAVSHLFRNFINRQVRVGQIKAGLAARSGA